MPPKKAPMPKTTEVMSTSVDLLGKLRTRLSWEKLVLRLAPGDDTKPVTYVSIKPALALIPAQEGATKPPTERRFVIQLSGGTTEVCKVTAGEFFGPMTTKDVASLKDWIFTNCKFFDAPALPKLDVVLVVSWLPKTKINARIIKDSPCTTEGRMIVEIMAVGGGNNEPVMFVDPNMISNRLKEMYPKLEEIDFGSYECPIFVEPSNVSGGELTALVMPFKEGTTLEEVTAKAISRIASKFLKGITGNYDKGFIIYVDDDESKTDPRSVYWSVATPKAPKPKRVVDESSPKRARTDIVGIKKSKAGSGAMHIHTLPLTEDVSNYIATYQKGFLEGFLHRRMEKLEESDKSITNNDMEKCLEYAINEARAKKMRDFDVLVVDYLKEEAMKHFQVKDNNRSEFDEVMHRALLGAAEHVYWKLVSAATTPHEAEQPQQQDDSNEEQPQQQDNEEEQPQQQDNEEEQPQPDEEADQAE